MSRISTSTKETIKRQIINLLHSSVDYTTFAIAQDIGRSWELTYEILNELKQQKIVKDNKIAHLHVWKLVDIDNIEVA